MYERHHQSYLSNTNMGSAKIYLYGYVSVNSGGSKHEESDSVQEQKIYFCD
jgi:hypothetical protein